MKFHFCPLCGASLLREKRDSQDVPVCRDASCGFVFWQNAKPCVSVLIPDTRGRILMAVRGVDPDKGKLDLPGGFLHEDEHPDDGAKREIREELGVDIGINEYLGFFVDQYAEEGQYSYRTLILCVVCYITKGVPRPMDDVSGIEWINPKTVSADRLAFTNNKKFLDMWNDKHAS